MLYAVPSESEGRHHLFPLFALKELLIIVVWDACLSPQVDTITWQSARYWENSNIFSVDTDCCDHWQGIKYHPLNYYNYNQLHDQERKASFWLWKLTGLIVNLKIFFIFSALYLSPIFSYLDANSMSSTSFFFAPNFTDQCVGCQKMDRDQLWCETYWQGLFLIFRMLVVVDFPQRPHKFINVI